MSDTITIPTNPITGLWTYKTKVITYLTLAVLLVLGAILGINDYRDTKAKLREQIAINSTNSEVMRKIGEAMVAQGQVAPAAAVKADATLALGKQITAYMAAQDASIRALYTAVGQLAQQVKTGAPVAVAPAKDGSFRAVNLVQARTGPALTEVKLDYHPGAADPNQRLTSSWTSYREDFTASLGEWQKKDHGYVAAITLKRDVFRADPQAATGYTQVGSEQVDMKDATATYNQDNFTSIAAAPPRWSLMLGAGHDPSAGKTTAAGILGYQLSDHWSGHLGQVGNVTLLGGAYHFSLGQ